MTFWKPLSFLEYKEANIFISSLLILQLFSFASFAVQQSGLGHSTSPDSLILHNFDGSNYRASSSNYMSDIDQDGIVYFGNENGLLEFDGTHWQLYKTPEFTAVMFLKIVGDRIYTFGGSNELGFFQRDQSGLMTYHSLKERLPQDFDSPYIFKAFELKGDVYFGADSSILKWDGEVFNAIKGENYVGLYKVEQELLVSVFGENGGLAKIEGDSLRIVNDEFIFENDYAWEILETKKGEWQIFTSESGVFSLDPDTYQTTKVNNQMSRYYSNDTTYLYYVEKFSDSLLIVSSWEKGMQIFNQDGILVKELDKETGLQWNYQTHPKQDRRGNLWLTGYFGIQYLQSYNPKEKFSFNPSAKIRYIKLGDSSVFIRDTSDFINLETENVKSLDFYFSVPSFLEKNLNFSFYLEGFDEDWSDWTTNSRKEYTNLPGGEYTMHLRAKHLNLDNVEISPFKFDLEIPKPWYNYSVSYVLFVIVFGLLIFGFVRYRTHRLTAANKKLEFIVKERTTELRSQKERLKKANEELKTINNELDNFVYRSSHDLVAPLKSLRGLISVAGMSNDPNEIKDYFKLMNISISKLEEFIKSIMDFSTNTKKPIEMRRVNMDDILDSIVEDLKFYENANKVELIRAYDSEFKIKTDPKRLNIVLSNLVTNALKYHDFKKDEAPYIKVSAKVENDSYVMEVEDNGSGIPEEHQSKIFEMFFRAHQGIEGSGLGLYIVVDTLNVLKGKIKLTSKVRKGTTFQVTLPLVD